MLLTIRLGFEIALFGGFLLVLLKTPEIAAEIRGLWRRAAFMSVSATMVAGILVLAHVSIWNPPPLPAARTAVQAESAAP